MTARRAPRSAWPLSIGISALLGDDSLDGSELGDEVGAGEVVVRDPAVAFDAPIANGCPMNGLCNWAQKP